MRALRLVLPTLVSQQDEEPAIAEPAPLIGELAQTDAQLGIGWPT
jgi:hypothetical protein